MASNLGTQLINMPADDGRMQLFAGNENGPNFFFVGENPNYIEVAEDYGIADPYNTVRGVAILDANEDGAFDLVYGNWGNIESSSIRGVALKMLRRPVGNRREFGQ